MEGLWLVSYIVLWLAVAGLSLTVLLILRQFGFMYLHTAEGVSRDGLPVGSRAPRFTAEDLGGYEHSVGDSNLSTILVFGSPHCQPCRRLVPELNIIADENAGQLRVLFVSNGRYEAISQFAKDTSIKVPVLSGGGDTLASLYKTRVTPFGFFIDSEGVIVRKGLVNTYDHLNWLATGESGRELQERGEGETLLIADRN